MTSLSTVMLADLFVRSELPDWLVLGFLFVLGATCGSFLNVCVYRLPRYPHGEFWAAIRGLVTPPSSCPRCGTRIRWYDNVPILGWILLRGRCRSCRMWISPQYPLIEFFNGCLFVLVYWCEVPLGLHVPLEESCLYSPLGPQAVPGLGSLSVEAWLHLRYAYHMVLIEALLVASLIDFRLKIIPDTTTLPAMAVGVLAAGIVGRLNIVPLWFQERRLALDFEYIGPEWLQWMIPQSSEVPAWFLEHPHLHGLAVSVAGLAVGGGLVWVVRAVGTWLLGREAMGDGDVVLMAMVGAFVGWQPVIIAFFLAPAFALASIAARVAMRWDDEIPYGPYLSLGTVATLLAWKPIWGNFQNMFSLGPLLVLFFGAGLALFVAILMTLQLIKRMLGITTDSVAPVGEWTAADQTHYFSGEQAQRHTNRRPPESEWPGLASGRGSGFYERWRYGKR